MTKATAPDAKRDRIVSKTDVMAAFGGISKATLYRWIAEGRFPRQVKIGPSRMGFFQSDIDAHMAKLRADRDAGRKVEAA